MASKVLAAFRSGFSPEPRCPETLRTLLSTVTILVPKPPPELAVVFVVVFFLVDFLAKSCDVWLACGRLEDTSGERVVKHETSRQALETISAIDSIVISVVIVAGCRRLWCGFETVEQRDVVRYGR